MENELYTALRSIEVESLSEDDKKELLRLFEASKLRPVYSEIAFIFSKVNYTEAIPSILKKINNNEFYNKNGSLIYALESMDVLAYFDSFVKIICEQTYLASMQALRIIEKIAQHTSISQRKKSLAILNSNLGKIKSMDNSPENDDRVRFILEAKEIIENINV